LAHSFIIIFAVSDVARAVDFYDQVFGWKKSVELAHFVEYECRDGLRLGIYQREAFAKNVNRPPHPTPHGEISGTELYVRVDDLDEIILNLMNAGAPVLSPRSPRPWGDEAAYFSDPDGNVIAVATSLV
jgi:predicted enzyme related to lactoylglutathione lyase